MAKFILVILLMFCGSSYAQNKYVSPNGNDASNGNTAATPYKTLQFAINNCSNNGGPVDTLFVRSGTGPFQPTASILVEKPIIIKNYLTEQPVIDGGSMVFNPGGYAIMFIQKAAGITIDGLIIQNVKYNSARGIAVLNNNGTATENTGNVTIKNCVFRNIGWILNDLDTFQPNSSIGCNAIQVQCTKTTPLRNVRIQNNEVYNCATGWGEAIIVVNNVDSFYIEDNYVHEIANIGIGAAGNYTYGGAITISPTLNQARNGFIRRNKVFNCMSPIAVSAGIYLDGARNCLVEDNETYSNAAGISLGAEQTIPAGITVGNHIVRNNLVWNNSLSGIFIGSNLSFNYLENTRITGNSFYKNTTGNTINGVSVIGGPGGQTVIQLMTGSNGEALLQNNKDCIFENNIVYAKNGTRIFTGMDGAFSSVDSSKNFKSNFNLFYREDNILEFYFGSRHNFNGTLINNTLNFTTYRQQTGLDLSSITANPLFQNISANNFQLNTCSPAINRGNTVYSAATNGTTDHALRPRIFEGRLDVGAYEVQQNNNPCTFGFTQSVVFCDSVTNRVTLRWSKPANADTFTVKLGAVTLAADITDTFYIHQPATAGSYSYSVTARNSTATSSAVTATVNLPGCVKTFTLDTVIAQCNTSTALARLNWTAAVNATGYSLYRNNSFHRAISNGSTITYTDTIANNTTYTYKIRAKNSLDSAFNSNGSKTVNNTLCPGIFNLDTVKAQCNGNQSQMYLSWSVAANVVKYSVYRDTGTNNPTLFYKQVTGNSLTDTVTPFRIYSYKILAITAADSLPNNNGFISRQAISCITTNIVTIDNIPVTIQVSPNPTGSIVFLNIKSSALISIRQLSLADNSGKFILNKPVNRNGLLYATSIDLSGYQAGTYNLIIFINNKRTVVQVLKL